MKPGILFIVFFYSFTLLPLPAFAQSALAVLEYHQSKSHETEDRIHKFTDRLREEFIRKGQIETLSKESTEEIFFYHRPFLQMNHPELPELKAGKQAYYELRLKEAEQLFRNVIASKEDERRDDGTLLEAYLLLGLTLSAAQEPKEAQGMFREALRLNPHLEINPHFFPPKIVKSFRELAQHNDLPTGTLQIHSKPEGSKVYLNGVFSGVTPLVLNSFPSGHHTVRLEAGHRQTRKTVISLKPNESKQVDLALAWSNRTPAPNLLGFNDWEVKDSEQLVQFVAAVGQQMQVQKVLLVGMNHESGTEQIQLRLVDTSLRASYKNHNFPVEKITERSAELATQIVSEITPDVRSNLLLHANKQEDRYEGDVLLLGKYRKPFYQRPLFWVVLGLAGAGGGVGAALVGGTAATGTLVVAF